MRNVLTMNREVFFTDKKNKTKQVLVLTHMYRLIIPEGPSQINLNLGVIKFRIDGIQANLYDGYYKPVH